MVVTFIGEGKMGKFPQGHVIVVKDAVFLIVSHNVISTQ
jgi:hypothetical protein